MKTQTRDMTTGEPARLILLFLLPILAGNALQQFYSLVDSFIIGQVNGVEALTAVSASGWLDWLVLSVLMGLTQGFSILIAQHFGAGDTHALRRSVGQSILLSVIVIVVLECLAQMFLTKIVSLVNTPEEIFDLEVAYLRIIFAGIPLIMVVNLLSGFLRSVGNSKTPLMAMIFSTLTNAVLDWLFVAGFHWGVHGAALATVLSQGISVLVCLYAFLHLPMLHPGKRDLVPDRKTIVKLLKLGSPLALGNIVISIGGLVLQSVVNGFGYIFAAGYNTASRLQGPIEIAGSSIGSAAATFIGQNYGAGRLDRVRDGLRKSLVMALAVSVLLSIVLLLHSRVLVSFFLNDDPDIVEQVLAYSCNFLQVMAYGLPPLYVLFIYRSALQGLGDTLIPMLSGFLELIMRITSALLLPRFIGMAGVYWAEILAWISGAILLVFGYYFRTHKLMRQSSQN